MTRARDIADLGNLSVPPPKGKNLLYNGAMQVAQRGMSATGITGTGFYTADRWWTLSPILGTWTQSVETDAPAGFGESLKMLCTTAQASPSASTYMAIVQQLEGQDLQRIAKGTASAQSLVLSFWVKSNVTGTYSVMLYDADNARFVSFTYTVTASATWEQKSILIPADTTGAFDSDNAASLQVYFNLGAGSDYTGGAAQTTWSSGTAFSTQWMPSQTNLAAATNNYWQITGVQLEVGETATEFENKKFGTELAECQRYYQKSYHYWDAPGTSPVNGNLVIAGMANTATSTGNHNVGFQFESRMRTAPNVTSYRADNGAPGELMYARHSTPAQGATASVTRVSDTGAAIFTANASGLTPGDAVELLFHYTADAEL